MTNIYRVLVRSAAIADPDEETGDDVWSIVWTGGDPGKAFAVARYQITQHGGDDVGLQSCSMTPWRDVVIPYPPDKETPENGV